MLVIHVGAVDLLLQKRNLIFKLLLQHRRLIQLAFRLFNGLVNTVHLLFHRLIFLFHICIAFPGMLKLALSNRKFLFYRLDLIPDPLCLKQKHINIIRF